MFEKNQLKEKIFSRNIRWIEEDSLYRLTDYFKRKYVGENEILETKRIFDTITVNKIYIKGLWGKSEDGLSISGSGSYSEDIIKPYITNEFRVGDIRSSFADIKLLKDSGFKNLIKLSSGLEEMTIYSASYPYGPFPDRILVTPFLEIGQTYFLRVYSAYPHKETLEDLWVKLNTFDSNLNNAIANKSYKLLVKKNYQIKNPLIIYHVSNNKVTLQNINLKINFELEENSSLRLIDLVKDGGRKNFINIFYNFSLEKNSVLKNYKIDQFENDNIRYMFNNIKQSSNSVSETFYLSKGSTFSKNEIFCDLKGEQSSAFVNGIFSLNKSKHHEVKAKINHLVENTKSYQLVKSVLENKSRSVYQGKIYVDSKAQKTDGYQLSKAILVDETTEFNAKPELEIYADDVKCSHGSASGSLDENSIFYLMSRGLSYKEARELLINGFLVEVINQITDEPIKKLIKNLYGLKNEY